MFDFGDFGNMVGGHTDTRKGKELPETVSLLAGSSDVDDEPRKGIFHGSLQTSAKARPFTRGRCPLNKNQKPKSKMISKFNLIEDRITNGYINRCVGRAATYALLSAPKLRSKSDSKEYQEALALRGLMRIWSKEAAHAIMEARK